MRTATAAVAAAAAAALPSPPSSVWTRTFSSSKKCAVRVRSRARDCKIGDKRARPNGANWIGARLQAADDVICFFLFVGLRAKILSLSLRFFAGNSKDASGVNFARTLAILAEDDDAAATK